MPQFCMHCGIGVSDGARFCASCGKETAIIRAAAPAAPSPRKTNWLKILLPTVIGLVLAGGTLVYMTVLGKAKNPGTATSQESARHEKFDPAEYERAPNVGTPGAVLKSESVEPSSSPQTVAVEHQISVTLPGGTIKAHASLAIRPISNPTSYPFKGVRLLKAFEISLGDQHEFSKDLTIEIPFDPEQVNTKVPLNKALMAAYWDEKQKGWVFAPSVEVDAARKIVKVRTSHLSSWAVFLLGPSYRILTSQGGDMSIFTIAYDPEAEINTTLWPNGVESFAKDVETYMEQAWKEYEHAGFKMSDTAPRVFIGNYKNSAWSVWSGVIDITVQDKYGKDSLKHEVFHELFHHVQNQYQSVATMVDRRWWIEAMADCAANDFSGTEDMQWLDPHYFEESLSRADGEHEYKTGRFLKFLVERGAQPKEMWEQSAHFSFTAMITLEQYIRQATGKDLLTHYREFSENGLFNSENKMMTSGTGALYDYGTVQRDALQPQVMDHPSAVNYEFHLKGNYTAQLWGIKVPASAETKKRLLKISAAEKHSNNVLEVDVYALKGGDKQAGGARRLATLNSRAGERYVEIREGEVLFVMALNSSAVPETFAVTVSDPAVGVTLSPPTVSLGEVNRPYTFTATVTGLPPNLKPLYRWASTFHTDGRETESESTKFSFGQQGSYEVTVQVLDASSKTMLAYATSRVHITRGEEVAKEPKREPPKREEPKKEQPKKEPPKKEESKQEPQKDPVIEMKMEVGYYDAAKTKKHLEYPYYIKDGVRYQHGTYQAWHENGKLSNQVECVHGKKKGADKSWDDKGRPTVIMDYKDGVYVPNTHYYWIYASDSDTTGVKKKGPS